MPINPSAFDVAVIGSGPAGATAALELAAAGLSVAIIEKASLPRYKTCGGGLLQRALRRLPFSVAAVIEQACVKAELHHHQPRLQFQGLRAEAMVSMVMRDRFDHLLTEEAVRRGAVLLAETTLQGFRTTKDGFILTTTRGEISTAFLVGADGVSSVVARKAGFPELRKVVPALECEVCLEPGDAAPFWSAARFDFGLTPYGYGWVFPKGDHLSIGVLTTRKGSCNLNDEYRGYLSALGIRKVVTEERHGYMIPLEPRRGLFSRPRILLVGDAAGLADPVTAEGITAAILSGQLAARSLVENWPRPSEVQRAYQRHLSQVLLRDLRVARWLSRLLYDHSKIRAWVFKRHGQRLTEFMTDVVMGDRQYREIFSRLLFNRGSKGPLGK